MIKLEELKKNMLSNIINS